MTVQRQQHEHDPKQVHVLTLKAGVPYETEQQVCQSCAQVLASRTLRRAAA